jgi:sulfatase maturation enzyme AslB (radical SAM superfamily)
MAQVYAAKYLAKAAMSAPRDLVRAAVAKYTPLHPTVFIFHCTFVCDARCEMCSNWTRGNRKEDMTLAQIEQAFSSNLWKDIENASISGGEPTTRNDLVDIARVMIDKFPKLRKLTLNTTGITHHRAIPMLTKIVQLCNERNVIFSTRVSIDGVGDMHGSVRNVRNAFDKAGKTIAAMKELQKTSTWCASPTPCWATPSCRASCGRWVPKSSACASSSSIACGRIRCSTGRTTSTCTTPT